MSNLAWHTADDAQPLVYWRFHYPIQRMAYHAKVFLAFLGKRLDGIDPPDGWSLLLAIATD